LPGAVSAVNGTV